MWLHVLLAAWLLMAGSENFNDGASLISKGIDPTPGAAANQAGAGPDASYAMNAEGGNAVRVSLDSCADSGRFTLTYDWNRTLFTSGSTTYHIVLGRFFDTYPDWNGGNPDFFRLLHTASADTVRVQWNTPPLGNNGGATLTFANAYPSVGIGWVRARLDVQFSSGIDGGTGQPTADASFAWSWAPWVGATPPAVLTTYAMASGLLITNPYVFGESRSYDFFDWDPYGFIDNVVWDDHCGETPVVLSTPVVNLSEACCANPPTTGSVPDPVGTFPAPIYTCEGGGQVEQVDDLPGMDGCFGTVAALSPVPLPVVLTPPTPVAEAPEPPTDVDFA